MIETNCKFDLIDDFQIISQMKLKEADSDYEYLQFLRKFRNKTCYLLPTCIISIAITILAILLVSLITISNNGLSKTTHQILLSIYLFLEITTMILSFILRAKEVLTRIFKVSTHFLLSISAFSSMVLLNQIFNSNILTLLLSFHALSLIKYICLTYSSIDILCILAHYILLFIYEITILFCYFHEYGESYKIVVSDLSFNLIILLIFLFVDNKTKIFLYLLYLINRNERKNNELLNTLQTGVIVLDREKISFMNETATRISETVSKNKLNSFASIIGPNTKRSSFKENKRIDRAISNLSVKIEADNDRYEREEINNTKKNFTFDLRSEKMRNEVNFQDPVATEENINQKPKTIKNILKKANSPAKKNTKKLVINDLKPNNFEKENNILSKVSQENKDFILFLLTDLVEVSDNIPHELKLKLLKDENESEEIDEKEILKSNNTAHALKDIPEKDYDSLVSFLFNQLCKKRLLIERSSAYLGTKEMNLRVGKNYTRSYSTSYLGSISTPPLKIEKMTIEIYFKVVNSEIIFFLHDVSRRKQHEEYQAQIKYHSLFLSKISHEFKNPILSIKELGDEIKEMTADKIKKEKVTFIQNICDYLIILVKDCSLFAEIDKKSLDYMPISYEGMCLKENINFCVEITKNRIKSFGKKVDVIVEYASAELEHLYFYSDKIRLRQILINILSNSVKFSNSGSIKIEITWKSRSKIYICVTDEGKGIEDRILNNLFKPFIKDNSLNNKYGAGLGLVIVKELIEKLKGRIEITSHLGEGTKVLLELPLNPFKENEKTRNINSNTCMPLVKFNRLEVFPLNRKSRSSGISLNSKGEIVLIKSNSFDSIKTITINFNQFERDKLMENRIIMNNIIIKDKYKDNENASVNMNTNTSNLFRTLLSESAKTSHLSRDQNYNILTGDLSKYDTFALIVDDEKIIRNSTLRILSEFYKKENKSPLILEADDGFEGLHTVFLVNKLNIKLNLILSDETMNFLTGSKMIEILDKYSNMLENTKILIVTSYENFKIPQRVDGVIKKPISILSLKDKIK